MKAYIYFVPSLLSLGFFVCGVHAATTAPVKDPKTGELVWEEITEVPAWSVTLIERRHAPEATDYILGDLQLAGKDGTRRTLLKDIVGPIVVFEEQKIVASCEGMGSISKGPAPIFVSLDGARKTGPKHLPQYIRRCERIPDSALLFIQYGLTERNLTPYNIVRIVSVSGETVLERRLDDAEQIEVLHEGKKYTIQVPKPEFPG